MSDSLDPTAQDLTPTQHLARARFLAAVFESRSAAFAGEIVLPGHLTEMRLYVEAARMHIELAREIDRQAPRPAVAELATAKLRFDAAREIADEVTLPPVAIDHPRRGPLRWDWEQLKWIPTTRSGEQGGTP